MFIRTISTIPYKEGIVNEKMKKFCSTFCGDSISFLLIRQKMILTDHNLVIENKEKIKALEETFKQFEEKKKVSDNF